MIPDPYRPGYYIAVVSKAWRDALRGYSDADERSMQAKLTGNHKPGSITWLTTREMAAFRATGIQFK